MLFDYHQMNAPATQIIQERSWLVHYGLFLFSQDPEGADLFYRNFFNREQIYVYTLITSYLSVIEINCPWILRYFAVIAMNQGRQGRSSLTRVADMIERSDVEVTDPILLFVYHLIIHMDFKAASNELSRCEDVFASDFFFVSCGVKFENVRDEVR